MKQNATFISFENEEPGLIFDQTDHPKYPLQYFNVINGQGVELRVDRSYYYYVYDGMLGVSHDYGARQFILSQGMYGSFSGQVEFKCNIVGKAVLIEVDHKGGEYPKTAFRAMSVMGGPIEDAGRLKYIDGCTDSLLIPPVKLGDPCFNHLHFPPHIDQTAHTHPSHRIGIVAKGHGECITPFGNLPLTEGMIFVIKEWNGEEMSEGLDGKIYPAGTHSFRTFNESMDVIAFHPDSDTGATDVDHPMINRTIVDGVSANKLDDIRTK